MGDTLLWWIALGYDAPQHDGRGDQGQPAPSRSEIVGYLEQAQGIARASTATSPSRRSSTTAIPDDEVVMCEANSLKDGAFNLAPGYGA